MKVVDRPTLRLFDREEALRRAVRRDAELWGSEAAARRRYRTRYVPGQQLYLDEVDPRRLADVVFENTKPESPSLVFREKAARSSHAAPLLRPQE
jgi:uridine kinase